MDITALLAISFWPYMIPFVLTIDEAAAPQSSLAFMLWGEGLFVFPLMLLYTIISYSVFRGKVASRAPALLRLLGSRTPVATIKPPPSSAGPVRCEAVERDNARGGPTFLTVRSGAHGGAMMGFACVYRSRKRLSGYLSDIPPSRSSCA
jgi:hypothetical protein